MLVKSVSVSLRAQQPLHLLCILQVKKNKDHSQKCCFCFLLLPDDIVLLKVKWVLPNDIVLLKVKWVFHDDIVVLKVKWVLHNDIVVLKVKWGNDPVLCALRNTGYVSGG